MNVVEAVLSAFLVAMMISGMMYAMTQTLNSRDAQRAVEQIGVYQDALVRHHQANPQDGVEDWFPAQCPATHAKATVRAPRLNGGGCEELATGAPPVCAAGHTLVPGSTAVPATCRMTTIPVGGCPANHTLVSGPAGAGLDACELDAVWTELASIDDPATPYHDGEVNLQKLDLHGLVEFSHSSQLSAGVAVSTPYGGRYRVLSNGASSHLRLEFDMTGFERAAYLVAQDIYPGLRSEIDPRPIPNVHDENTAYTVAVHLRPGTARHLHEHVIDAVEVGNPGSGFGSPLLFAHPQYRGPGGEDHRAGARCDRFRQGLSGAFVTDADGWFLTCRDDPRGIVTDGPIWVRSYEFEAVVGGCLGGICAPAACSPPPPPGTDLITVCPDDRGLVAGCDLYQAGTFPPYDAYPPWPGSGRSTLCRANPDPCVTDPSLCAQPDQCGLSITESGGNATVQFYHIDGAASNRTNGAAPITGPLAQFGLTVADVPASDRIDGAIDTFITNNPGFAAWVAGTDGQAAQSAITGLGCSYGGQAHQCGVRLDYAGEDHYQPGLAVWNYENAFLDDLSVQFFDESTTPVTYGTETTVNAPDVGLGPNWSSIWRDICGFDSNCGGLDGATLLDRAEVEIESASGLTFAHATPPADLSTFLANHPAFGAWFTTPAGQALYDTACNVSGVPECTLPMIQSAVNDTTGICVTSGGVVHTTAYESFVCVTTADSSPAMHTNWYQNTPGYSQQWDRRSSAPLCEGGVAANLQSAGWVGVPGHTLPQPTGFWAPNQVASSLDANGVGYLTLSGGGVSVNVPQGQMSVPACDDVDAPAHPSPLFSMGWPTEHFVGTDQCYCLSCLPVQGTN